MSQKKPGEIRLNANQRRHYEILFSRLELSLEQIERAIRGETLNTQLTTSIDDLPERFIAEAGPMIAALRAETLEIVRSLGLRPREVSRRRTIQALISSEMNGVQDGLATRLRGYGDVDASVAEHLDPQLKRLHTGLAELGALLRESS
jgi:hypothetical protein